MIRNFGNKTASDIFHNGYSKTLPRRHWRRAVHLLEVMEAVESLQELKSRGFPPNVRLHTLLGQRRGQWAVDIHKTSGWRITFQFKNNEFLNARIEDYH